MKLLIPPAAQVLISAGLMLACGRYLPQLGFEFSGQTQIATFATIGASIILFFSIRLFSKENTTVNPYTPEKSGRLVTTGIYRFTRNPMYLGMAVLLFAQGMWLGTWVFVPVLVLFVSYMTCFQILPEEEALIEKFDEEYAEYCTKVRRWI